MTNKTKNLIIKILEEKLLEEKQDLGAHEIGTKLEEIGYSVTYDTISRNLKEMTDSGELERYAKGKPWYYYYKIKKTKEGL